MYEAVTKVSEVGIESVVAGTKFVKLELVGKGNDVAVVVWDAFVCELLF